MLNIKRIYFIVAISFSSICFSQNTSLDELDSTAFTQLENNDPNVLKTAEIFLNESRKEPPSIYGINAHIILGILDKNRGYYVGSIQQYLSALKIAKSISDKGRQSACLNNIGTLYKIQENYEMAIQYFEESIEIEKQLDNPAQKSIRFYNLGEVYSLVDSFDLALSYFTNSLLIEKKINNTEGINYAHLGICEVYIKSGRLKDAEQTLKAITLPENSNNSIEEQIIYFKLSGFLEVKKSMYQLGLSKIEKAISIANRYEMINYIPSLLLLKSECYNKMGMYKEALDILKKQNSITKELKSIKIKNQFADLTYQNKLLEKELEIKLLNEQKLLTEHNLKEHQLINSYSTRIIIFTIVMLIAIFSLILILFKKQSNN